VSAKIYVSQGHVCVSLRPKSFLTLPREVDEMDKFIYITGSLRLELSLFFRETEVGDSEIEKTRSGQEEAFKNCYVSGPPRARSA
jgi:hypothetical protein